MTTQKLILGKLYLNIAKELDISKTQFEKAERSYLAIGEWIGKQELDYNVRIFPQGSFNLGTVVRPLSDKDEYDIDLVCLLSKDEYDPMMLSAEELKSKIGKHLTSHDTYKKMLDSEGKRCWKLQYNEYHMDILPAIPDSLRYKEDSLIKITNTDNYSDYTYQPSNPEAYKTWLMEQVNKTLDTRMLESFIKSEVDIEKVPEQMIKKPLQRVIQILKRHRDIVYEKNDDIKPISCIVTTLAAKAYNGETNIYNALCSVLNNMERHIVINRNTNNFEILNPVMSGENFADKWETEPEKAKAFFNWLRIAKDDLLNTPLNLGGNDEIGEYFKKSLGEAVTQRGFAKYGESINEDIKAGKIKIMTGSGMLSSSGSLVSPAHKNYGN